ncbi:E3 ubiquitin-protein ligase rnf8-like isoform X2 [Cherax quadricarinatus]|uniref:E3 ubiquitin-protein ligase rnf8-like isoform X2 n=1 Tax=Cherax quadricarinatus TaxID=27406 RepID=UPI00387E9A4D
MVDTAAAAAVQMSSYSQSSEHMEKRRCYYLKRVLCSNNQHSVIPFKKHEVLIGRSPEATYIIPDHLISRRHAFFRFTNHRWTVTNLSLNGVFVNDVPIAKEVEHELSVGAKIQIGQPATFVFEFRVKEVNVRIESSSQESNIKRIKSEGKSVQINLTQEHAVLEEQLKKSDALQARLQQERDHLRTSLHQQQEQLQERYQREREELEMQFTAGALAQQALLEEKEALAQRLKMQVAELQGHLEEERKTLEERLRKEEEQRNHILQEKENVLRRLQEEKANLEVKLAEERQCLQEQLKATESHREELRQQIEAKESAIRVMEADQEQAEQEKEKLKEELVQERLKLEEELENVKKELAEKEITNVLLDFELKEKEKELHKKLSTLESGMEERVTEEVKKSTALVHEKAMKDLQQVLEDKRKLEQQLQRTQAQDHEELVSLHEALQTLEAQKMSLEQELASTAVASEHARKEVVESVSDVVENEFQCPICSELFITAIMLNCSHTFCQHCIDQWKKNKKDCPNCRTRITSETRSLVVDNFIDKIVPTLSEDLKKKRAEIVAERKAAVDAAQAQAAAAETGRGRGRGRRRGRGGNRNLWRDEPQPAVERASRPHEVQGMSGPSAENNEAGRFVRNSFVTYRDGTSHGFPIIYPHQRNQRPRTAGPPFQVESNEPLSTSSSRQIEDQSQEGHNQPELNQLAGASHALNPVLQGSDNSTSVSQTTETEFSEAISVSSNTDTTDTSINSDSSSISGDEGIYYGGYGRCFTCGRRGHWANGCPDRWY